jgi:hypothetical protein
MLIESAFAGEWLRHGGCCLPGMRPRSPGPSAASVSSLGRSETLTKEEDVNGHSKYLHGRDLDFQD